MKNGFLFRMVVPLGLIVASVACSRTAEEQSAGLPSDFNSFDDVSKVAYLMKNSTPDSVARFICEASLGKLPDARIDTFAIAAAYAYEMYSGNDSSLRVFSEEIDRYPETLGLPDKMKIYFMSGKSDPSRMGYQLGLEYLNHIRENAMTVDQIKAEIEAFRQACGEDSVTYKRFLKGFNIVLKHDHGNDLPEEIYDSFINY
ncbi:MAG: hypothetical protein K2I16_09765 [Muribaculaceae bacterium]|nr:hypothetical protein [Muribaculaceae bacterium]